MPLYSTSLVAVFAGLVILASAQFPGGHYPGGHYPGGQYPPGQYQYRCQVPKVTGNCLTSRPRYYFNYQLGICEKFIYSGCGGNSNNFHTLTECRAVCGGEDLCLQPVLQGQCQGYYDRYFYDHYSGTCRRFVYGGCGGNCNNFHTLQDCQFQCC
ncbi:BPTI/Kunitz domain-containing protein-like [Haliotis rufescens]|uniref:BPTI/Kunitz domain-containing protein-like n=1 Tax=Haliotis rufescens TaxID=6454 RepID=UPI00201ECA54|nr:BPTI/Kunitz domain-containing protein-like [Haliotis rufescens]